MSLKEVMDLMFKAGERVAHLWNFSVIQTAITIGWLLSTIKTSNTMAPNLKVTIFFVYTIVLGLSLVALLDAYRLFLGLVKAAKLRAKEAEDDALRRIIESLSYEGRPLVAVLSHLAYLAIVNFLLWFDFS